jgi:hypothetical protein
MGKSCAESLTKSKLKINNPGICRHKKLVSLDIIRALNYFKNCPKLQQRILLKRQLIILQGKGVPVFLQSDESFYQPS